MATHTYQVTGLDSDDCTVVSREAYTLKAAKREVIEMRDDATYADIVRIEVTDDVSGDVVLDWNKA